MNKIELNHWYLKENELRIALMRFHVKIKVLKNSQDIYFQLTLNKGEEELVFNFNSLEDAVSFTEQIIDKCYSNQEVIERYTELFGNNELGKKSKKEENNIFLTPEEVDQALTEYFGKDKDYRVSVKEELSLYNDKLDIKFYLTEHLNYDGIKKDYTVLLTNGDLRNVLSDYVEFYGYELIYFEFMSGIDRVGYYYDKDTMHYDGIKLKVKEKEKTLIRK